VIGDISGTSVSYRATESTLLTDSSDHPKYFHSATLDSTSFVLTYVRTEGGNDGYIAICSISGDDVNIGTPVNWGTPVLLYFYSTPVDVIDSTNAVISYFKLDTDYKVCVRLVAISGTVPTVGSENVYGVASDDETNPLVRVADTSTLFVPFLSADNATGDDYVRYVLGTLTGGGGTRTNNVFIGAGAGGGEDVSNSVCIGQAAGAQETNSYRMYIDVTNTTTPLIYGEFDDDNIGINGVDMAGGEGVIFIANATTAPTGTPTGGGVLYVEGGALKYKGSSGTVTTLGVA